MNGAVQVRLRFIDLILQHYGSIRRAVLMDYFGISSPQASADFGEYQKVADGNMKYDMKAKMYVRTESFKRKFP
jgi:hypothetical protein